MGCDTRDDCVQANKDQRCTISAQMGGGGGSSDPITYLSASGIAAVLNFPLWKAATIGQSGFAAAADSLYARMRILFGPPYRGVAATMFGMTWARAAIFYCSD